jgi:hypothetical protein
MKIHKKRCVAALAVAMLTLTIAPQVKANEALAEARELYASAAYKDALTTLNGLRDGEHSLEERRLIDLYRTLCLVALGRQAEADRAVESMIAQDPLYRPSTEDLSPRMRSAFSEARKRMLPSIIQQMYSDAKAVFDRQDFSAAAARFQQVLDGLADPDLGAAAAQQPLADLRTLATGFHDLSVKAMAPPPLPPAAARPSPEPATAARPSPEPSVAARPSAESAVPVPSRLYSAEDRRVVAPVVIQQRIPPIRAKVLTAATGVVEVIINTSGTVESARMSTPLNGLHDNLVLAAARTWSYQPAKLEGAPVRYRKSVEVKLLPTP